MNENNAVARDAEFIRVLAAVEEALRNAGFGRRKRPKPAPLGYSPPDAAEAAGVGTTTIYIAVRNKELPAKKRGTRTIILATDLKRWLEALPSAHLSPEA